MRPVNEARLDEYADLRRQGYDRTHIARQFGVSVRSLTRWLARHRDDPRCGMPKLTSDHQHLHLPPTKTLANPVAVHKARLTVCSHAADPSDARRLLTMLGIGTI